MIYLSFNGKKNGRCCPTCLVTHCCPGLAVAEEVLAFADFFALMPPDNAATVAPGTDVSFPQDGPTSGTVLLVLVPVHLTCLQLALIRSCFR